MSKDLIGLENLPFLDSVEAHIQDSLIFYPQKYSFMWLFILSDKANIFVGWICIKLGLEMWGKLFPDRGSPPAAALLGLRK